MCMLGCVPCLLGSLLLFGWLVCLTVCLSVLSDVSLLLASIPVYLVCVHMSTVAQRGVGTLLFFLPSFFVAVVVVVDVVFSLFLFLALNRGVLHIFITFVVLVVCWLGYFDGVLKLMLYFSTIFFFIFFLRLFSWLSSFNVIITITATAIIFAVCVKFRESAIIWVYFFFCWPWIAKGSFVVQLGLIFFRLDFFFLGSWEIFVNDSCLLWMLKWFCFLSCTYFVVRF